MMVDKHRFLAKKKIRRKFNEINVDVKTKVLLVSKSVYNIIGVIYR